MKFYTLFIALIFSYFSTNSNSSAPVYEIPIEQESVEFVKGLVDKGTTIANNLNAPEGEFARLLNDNFVTDDIARFVAGPLWKQMTADQQKKFHDLYIKRLLQIYSDPAKVKTFKGTTAKVEEKGTKQIDGSVLVKSTFTNPTNANAEPAKVDWKVVKKNGKLYILDVMFEGISKLLTERKDYHSLYVSECGSDIQKFLDKLTLKVGIQSKL